MRNLTSIELQQDRETVRESRRVHLAKMVTWRILATTTTFVIVYTLTGDLKAGAAVGGIELIAKMALYYGHERAWTKALRTGLLSVRSKAMTELDVSQHRHQEQDT